MSLTNRPTNLGTRSHPRGCSRFTGLTWLVRPGDGTLPSGAMVLSPETFRCLLLCSRQPCLEAGAVGEHAVHDYRQLARESHLGLLHACPAGDLGGPALEL